MDASTILRNNRSEQVFCQIDNKRISVGKCKLIQGTDGCFGCGAHSRMCEGKECQGMLPATIAVLGLCDLCTTKALEEETPLEKQRFYGKKTFCKMQKSEINVSTCFKLQTMKGSYKDGGCRDCISSSYICEKEGCDNGVRLPQAGLCMSHTIDTFAKDWVKPTQDRLSAMKEQARVLTERKIYSSSSVKQGQDISMNSVNGTKKIEADKAVESETPTAETNKEGQASDEYISRKEGTELCPNCDKNPKMFKKRFCWACYNEKSVEEFVHDTNLFKHYVDKAKKFLKKRETFAARDMKKHLGIGESRNRAILRDLAKQGLISEIRSGRRIIVLGNHHDGPADGDTVTNANNSPNSSVVPNKNLISYTKKLLAGKERIGTTELREKLRVGYYTAQQIMNELEAQGIVGPPRSHGRARAVGVVNHTTETEENKKDANAVQPPADHPTNHADNTDSLHTYTLKEQKAGIERLITVIGKEGEFGQLLQNVAATLESVSDGYVLRADYERLVKHLQHALECANIRTL